MSEVLAVTRGGVGRRSPAPRCGARAMGEAVVVVDSTSACWHRLIMGANGGGSTSSMWCRALNFHKLSFATRPVFGRSRIPDQGMDALTDKGVGNIM
jgi:hypothetical protein